MLSENQLKSLRHLARFDLMDHQRNAIPISAERNRPVPQITWELYIQPEDCPIAGMYPELLDLEGGGDCLCISIKKDTRGNW